MQTNLAGGSAGVVLRMKTGREGQDPPLQGNSRGNGSFGCAALQRAQDDRGMWKADSSACHSEQAEGASKNPFSFGFAFGIPGRRVGRGLGPAAAEAAADSPKADANPTQPCTAGASPRPTGGFGAAYGIREGEQYRARNGSNDKRKAGCALTPAACRRKSPVSFTTRYRAISKKER